MKAAITTGSLGKQRGGGNYDGDPDNLLGSSRYGATTYQIIQIGANIISQSTTNSFPTAICLYGNGQAPIIYGDEDLPYLYRSRLLTASVGYFSGKAMLDNGTGGGKNSVLAAVMVQPELWNPHAPNLLAPTSNYPTSFRVVPRTGNITPHTALSVTCYFGQNAGQNWAIGGTNPNMGTPESNGIMTGDYTLMGGPNITKQIVYDNTKPDAYIGFSSTADLLPSGTIPSPLGSFREPCPLAAPDFPPNIGLTSFPVPTSSNPVLSPSNGAVFTGLPNTLITNTSAVGNGNAIPPRFTVASNATSMGFLVAYYCGGPGKTLATMQNVTGGPMILDLQYGVNGQFYTYDTIQSAFPPKFTEITAPSGSQQTEQGVRTDPRTNRWGLVWHGIPYGSGVYGTTTSPGTGQYESQAGRTFDYSGDLTVTNYGTGGTQNQPKAPGWMGALTTGPNQLGWTQINKTDINGNYYQDPDGVVRSADGAYVTVGTPATGTNPLGLPMAMLSATNNSQGGALSNYDSRPVVLNRPFQSVAELGYVFRDTPWRDLDFFTPESGDSALLDVFTVYGPDPYSYKDAFLAEPTGIVAAKVNLNTRQQPVLAALLKGASTTTVFSPSTVNTPLMTLNDTQAAAVAQALVQWTTNATSNTAGPLLNPAELVGKYTANTATGSTRYNGFSSTLTNALNPSGNAAEVSIIKGQRECVMHALADAGTTRTWNLLIDLVAQTGQLAPNATGLQNFVVNGEHHVWVSVALDRVTGKVIKMQVEPVRL